jgi:hypothetical protein
VCSAVEQAASANFWFYLIKKILVLSVALFKMLLSIILLSFNPTSIKNLGTGV